MSRLFNPRWSQISPNVNFGICGPTRRCMQRLSFKSNLSQRGNKPQSSIIKELVYLSIETNSNGSIYSQDHNLVLVSAAMRAASASSHRAWSRSCRSWDAGLSLLRSRKCLKNNRKPSLNTRSLADGETRMNASRQSSSDSCNSIDSSIWRRNFTSFLFISANSMTCKTKFTIAFAEQKEVGVAPRVKQPVLS